MLAHNFFDDPYQQMERMRRRMLREFERSFYSPLSLYDDTGFGLTPFRDPFYRPVRYEPEFLSLRMPDLSAIEKAIKEPEKLPIDDKTTFYGKYEVNKNGHVYKKTVEKNPGEQWKTNVEEYDVKPALNDQETKEVKDSETPKSLDNKQDAAPAEDKIEIEDVKC